MRRRLIYCVLALLALLGACQTGPGQGSSLNFAAAFGWGGYVDTDMAFSEFFAEDHTVVARFMPQYPVAYAGPVFAENGSGTFFVGQQSHTETSPRLVVAIGSQQQDYEVELVAETWHHLTLVRSGNNFRLYLDGQRLMPDLVVNPNDASLPAMQATLRLARRTTGKTFVFNGDGREPQFYGLVDDVAVFGRALNQGEIQTLVNGMPRLDPALMPLAWDLLAAWTFDSATPSGEGLPAPFARPVAFHSPADDGVIYEGVGDLVPAQAVPVSPLRHDATDAQFLLPPFHQSTYTFPTKPGQAWWVIWGNNTLNSHFGFAAFTWDIILASTDANTGLEDSDPTSCEQPLYAIASGTVTRADDNEYSDEWQDGENALTISTAPDETASYLHIRTGSVDDAGVQVNEHVQAGQLVAEVGTRKTDNCHLHFGVRSETVTIPVAFTDYEASDDEGETWYYVARGIPQHDQWIRTTGDNDSPTVEIVAPGHGANIWYGGLGSPFEAITSDTEDGGACCAVSWTSDIDGFLGEGKQNNFALSPGTHLITARAQDSFGAVGTDSIVVHAVNVAPTVTIVVPTQRQSLFRDYPYAFQAQVDDVNEGSLCSQTVWTSSGPDAAAAGCAPTFTFTSNGSRTLTVTATDALGLTGTDTVAVTVVDPPPTGPPIVTILEPDDGDGLGPDDSRTLEGTATDPDGETPLVFEWFATDYFSQEHAIGTGATIQWTPSDDVPFTCGGGQVTLRLDVTDPDGETGTDSIEVYIAYPPC